MDNRKHKQPEDLPERSTKGKRMQVSARPERWQQQLSGWQDHHGSQGGSSADKDTAPSRGFDDTHQAQANDSQQDQPRAKRHSMSKEEREMLPPVPIIAGDKEFELCWNKTLKGNLDAIKEECPELAKNLNEESIRKMRSFYQQKSGAWSINHEKLSNDQKTTLMGNMNNNNKRLNKYREKCLGEIGQESVLQGGQANQEGGEGSSADKDAAPSRGFDDTHQAQANDSQQDQPRAKKRRMSQEERKMPSSVPIIAGDKEFELHWNKTSKGNLDAIKKECPELTKSLNEMAICKMRSLHQQKSGAWSINREKLNNDQKSTLNYNLKSKIEDHKKYRKDNKDKIKQTENKYCKDNKLLINSIRNYREKIVSIYRKYIKIQEIRYSIETQDVGRNKDGSASSRSQQSQAQVQEYRKHIAKMQKQMKQMYHKLWDLEHTLHVLYQERAQRKANPSDQREESALQGGQPSQERGEGSNAPVQQAEHWTGMGFAEGVPNQETVGLQARRPPLPDNWQDFLKSVQASPIGAKLLKSMKKQLIALRQAEHTESGAEPMATEGLQLPPEQSFPTNQDQEIRDEWTDPHANTAGSDQHAGDIWDDPHIWKLLQTWENDHANSSIQDEMNELHNDPIEHEMLYVFLDENYNDSSSKARPSTETGPSQLASTDEIFMLSVPPAASRLGPLEDCSSESKLVSGVEEVDRWLNLEP